MLSRDWRGGKHAKTPHLPSYEGIWEDTHYFGAGFVGLQDRRLLETGIAKTIVVNKLQKIVRGRHGERHHG